jgi:hypothetical protein
VRGEDVPGELVNDDQLNFFSVGIEIAVSHPENKKA